MQRARFPKSRKGFRLVAALNHGLRWRAWWADGVATCMRYRFLSDDGLCRGLTVIACIPDVN